ncbi:MAG: MBL fold metallo-hydrolase [Deltaproteobacteria bacterium]|nr:MBL fold metallo-hydrolase [Deltaproteobacteria bacterium]
MKIIPVMGKHNIYSSNVYLVLGEWKRIEDPNTLVDVGNDPSIIDIIENMNTGIGKNKVEQVILTHSHSDHTGILPLIKAAFHPRIYAFSPFMEGVDHVLKHGDMLRVGDGMIEVIHTPCHTDDSICLYNKDQGDLFVGDTPVIIQSVDGVYDDNFYLAMKSLCSRDIQTIYFGHGAPLSRNAQDLLQASLQNLRKSLKNKKE